MVNIGIRQKLRTKNVAPIVSADKSLLLVLLRRITGAFIAK